MTILLPKAKPLIQKIKLHKNYTFLIRLKTRNACHIQFTNVCQHTRQSPPAKLSQNKSNNDQTKIIINRHKTLIKRAAFNIF
jgi:hypothetical protein